MVSIVNGLSAVARWDAALPSTAMFSSVHQPRHPDGFGPCVRRDATLRFKAVLAAQPFREWACSDADLRAPQHRAEELHFSKKIPLWKAFCFALHGHLCLLSP